MKCTKCLFFVLIALFSFLQNVQPQDKGQGNFQSRFVYPDIAFDFLIAQDYFENMAKEFTAKNIYGKWMLIGFASTYSQKIFSSDQSEHSVTEIFDRDGIHFDNCNIGLLEFSSSLDRRLDSEGIISVADKIGRSCHGKIALNSLIFSHSYDGGQKDMECRLYGATRMLCRVIPSKIFIEDFYSYYLYSKVKD